MKRHRCLDNGVPSGKVMPLDQAVNFVQRHRIILHYDNQSQVGLYTPGRKLPMDFKRGIFKHCPELLNLMQAGDVRLCPAPELHRQSWQHERCAMCVQLDKSLLTELHGERVAM